MVDGHKPRRGLRGLRGGDLAKREGQSCCSQVTLHRNRLRSVASDLAAPLRSTFCQVSSCCLNAEISSGPQGVTCNGIQRAFLATEESFIALVSQLWNTRPDIATTGSCCLVGVVCRQTLYVANLGDSRIILGKKVGSTGEIAAISLSTEHNANMDAVRQELQAQHPNDPQIVILKHGVWRIKGIIQVSRSIGDAYMKHAQYNREPINPKFRIAEPMDMPILTENPSIIHPRAGSAKSLIKAALHEAARKREMRYSDLKRIDKKVRRHFQDDITVIIIFLNHEKVEDHMKVPQLSVRSALDH
ncbi:hypothetical protein OPV22_028711 [Ensete ventricosum]|uniref:protein-serine/threonine phosphatase n=1 Tax=Ensete ventricosum TaxID=4639 RepID=A0AAV8Q4G9_ENSVE|nr:hypothetical protein OPV22_028711 [Ensete ventricosum]